MATSTVLALAVRLLSVYRASSHKPLSNDTLPYTCRGFPALVRIITSDSGVARTRNGFSD